MQLYAMSFNVLHCNNYITTKSYNEMQRDTLLSRDSLYQFKCLERDVFLVQNSAFKIEEPAI